MKEYIYQQYLKNICSHIRVESSDLFVKSKETGVVDARQLLYYLCFNNSNMGLTEISRYTSNQGFHEDQANISRSIESFTKKLEADKDLQAIVDKIKRVEV
jgi:chromosomal replication initiation ATPase DnaA